MSSCQAYFSLCYRDRRYRPVMFAHIDHILGLPLNWAMRTIVISRLVGVATKVISLGAIGGHPSLRRISSQSAEPIAG